jgi:hypothetical protein
MSVRPYTAVDWTVAPLSERSVLFDLAGLAAGVRRLGGAPANGDRRRGRPGAIEAALSAGPPLVDRLAEGPRVLERGAALVFTWRPDALRGVPAIERALDPRVVLNVLGRARSQLLLATSPLVLERPFLDRALWSDDPRLVQLVRTTGSKQEQTR